jgi:gamma-glutamyl:cysteine ligase YbdK (ATP-grasp superfamily)
MAGTLLSTSYDSGVSKVAQMDRRGHAMQGMDAIYVHPTDEMRQRLCDVLEQLWQTAVAQRYELASRSAVPLLNEILIAYEQGLAGGTAPQGAPQDA